VRGVNLFDPGTLKHRLTLQRIVETPDGCGGVVNTWEDETDLWANIQPLGVNSDYLALQQREVASHRIIVRYTTPLSSGWRFALGSRVFRIKTIHDPDERKAYLVCLVDEEGL